MRLEVAWAIGLCATTINAFRDTSPFLAFSTEKFFDNGDLQSRAATGAHISSSLRKSLSSCPTDAYIIVNQPDISSQDFKNSRNVHYLRTQVLQQGKHDGSSIIVSDVLGAVSTQELEHDLSKNCGAIAVKSNALSGYIDQNDRFPQYLTLNFAALPSKPKERASKLAEHDSLLNAIVNNFEDRSYTVIYTTTPPQQKPAAAQHSNHDFEYDEENQFPSAIHMDLKRDMHGIERRQNSGRNSSSAPLFETYTFLSPGIFMGGTVLVILGSLLYVGLSAIAGMEVSYGSFSKEMGPAAQKKQQ